MRYETKDGGFKSFGEFLVTARKVRDGELKDSRLISAEIGKTAGHMAIGEDSQGGFLVPEQYVSEVLHAALEDAIVRPRAKVFPATSDSLKIPRLVETDRSSNYFGGITFRWLYEAAQKSYSTKITKPSVGQLELTVHKAIGSCWVSNELESDAMAFGEFMRVSFGQAIRFEEDYQFIWGSGVGQPLGAAHASNGSRIAVPRLQANAIIYADVLQMTERLLPGCWGSSSTVWLANPDTVTHLMELDSAETDVVNIIDINDRKMFGFPVIFTEKAAPLGTAGDLILADFAHYAIADREMVIAGSRHVERSNVGFTTDESYWKVQLRVDGQPTLTNAITPKRGVNTLSPFVVLSDFVS